MSQPLPSERRKFARLGTDQLISFAPVNTREQLAVGRNVSPGGMRFEAIGCELELGEVLHLTFNVGEETVSAIGRVAWATEMDPLTLDVGIEFLEIDGEVLRALEDAQQEA